MTIKRRFKHTALVGPSGGGKTTISHLMQKLYPQELEICISATSRPMRVGETDNVHYRFVHPKKFEEMIELNEFYEWEMPFKDAYYGTPRKEFDEIVSSGKSVILDIDIKGFRSMKKIYKDDLFGVFINTSPDMVKYLFQVRGNTSQRDIERRLKRALEEEYPCMSELDYIQPNGIGYDLNTIANTILNKSLY